VGPKQLWVESDGDGPPIVFVHGLGGTATFYEAQALALASEYHVIRFDLEGHGRSPMSQAPDIASWADDLGNVLDALPAAKATIVGHSLGALVVQHFAATRPDRVENLVLLGTLKTIPDATRQVVTDRAAIVRKAGMGEIAGNIATATTGSRTHRDRPELIGFVKELLLGQDSEAYALGCEALAKAHEPDLATFAAPTLLITGSDDTVTTPEQANVLADSLQRATVAIVDGIGHWSAVEASADVSRLIREFMHDQRGPTERGESVR
jgi:3-oxoadipate enol-lactonase